MAELMLSHGVHRHFMATSLQFAMRFHSISSLVPNHYTAGQQVDVLCRPFGNTILKLIFFCMYYMLIHRGVNGG